MSHLGLQGTNRGTCVALLLASPGGPPVRVLAGPFSGPAAGCAFELQQHACLPAAAGSERGSCAASGATPAWAAQLLTQVCCA